jgi:hypothetical protein
VTLYKLTSWTRPPEHTSPWGLLLCASPGQPSPHSGRRPPWVALPVVAFVPNSLAMDPSKSAARDRRRQGSSSPFGDPFLRHVTVPLINVWPEHIYLLWFWVLLHGSPAKRGWMQHCDWVQAFLGLFTTPFTQGSCRQSHSDERSHVKVCKHYYKQEP